MIDQRSFSFARFQCTQSIGLPVRLDDAQKVAVQLTRALAELRDDLAAGAAGQSTRSSQPMARGGGNPKIEVLID